MTKKQEARYNKYISALKRGRKSLYQYYNKYSDEKAHAWQAIAKRCNDVKGVGLTIVCGNQFTFSTGYIECTLHQAVLVFNTPSTVDRINLSTEQRQEVSKLLCLTV